MSSSNKKQSNNGDKARRGGKVKVSHNYVENVLLSVAQCSAVATFILMTRLVCNISSITVIITAQQQHDLQDSRAGHQDEHS